jgi:hypothetical protein
VFQRDFAALVMALFKPDSLIENLRSQFGFPSPFLSQNLFGLISVSGFDDPESVQLVDGSSIRVVRAVRSVNRMELDGVKQRVVMFWASIDPADHLPAVAKGLAVSFVETDLAQIVIQAEGSAIESSSGPK